MGWCSGGELADEVVITSIDECLADTDTKCVCSIKTLNQKGCECGGI